MQTSFLNVLDSVSVMLYLKNLDPYWKGVFQNGNMVIISNFLSISSLGLPNLDFQVLPSIEIVIHSFLLPFFHN